MNIGEQIKKYRKEAGLSQKELGERLGVSQQHIAQYESGKRIPKIETIIKIATALDISPFEVISVDEYNRLIDLAVSKQIQHDIKIGKAHLVSSERSPDSEMHKFDDSIRVEITPETLENLKQVNIILEKIENGEQLTENNLQVLKNYIQRQETARKRLKGTMQTMQEILDRLNEVGQEEAVKRVEELSEIPRYTKPDEPPQE